jgi:hypothetical protein
LRRKLPVRVGDTVSKIVYTTRSVCIAPVLLYSEIDDNAMWYLAMTV